MDRAAQTARRQPGRRQTGRRLRRSRRRRLVAGVCGGLAEYLNLPILLVRIVVAIVTAIPVLPGLPIYLLMWLLVPLEEDP